MAKGSKGSSSKSASKGSKTVKKSRVPVAVSMDRKYEIESNLSTLRRAAEIKANPKLLKECKTMAQNDMMVVKQGVGKR